jgi:hypothetical protein
MINDVEERVFHFEDKAVLDDETLKMQGFKYEGAANVNPKKTGFYMVIKAEKKWFEAKETKEALKKMTEVKGKEKDEILKKFAVLEDSVTAGIGSIFD